MVPIAITTTAQGTPRESEFAKSAVGVGAGHPVLEVGTVGRIARTTAPP